MKPATARQQVSYGSAEAIPPDPYGAFLSRCPAEMPRKGPLAGLSVAVKDNIEVEGQPFTAGLPLFENRTASKDAYVVSLLKDAGAVISGLTVTDAAGFGVLTPKVKNPVLEGRAVGGSSGGAAAAVAAGLAQVGLGTDTGGSIRIPAACCGLFGFKPSHGAILTDGVWPLAPSFDTLGFITRDLAPLEKTLQFVLGWDEAPVLPGSLRLGIDPRHLHACDVEVIIAIDALWPKLSSERIQLHAVDLPDRDAVVRAHSTMVLSEAWKLYAQIWRDTPELLPETAQRALRSAERLTKQKVAEAEAFVAEVKVRLANLAQQVDAFVSPTMPIMPPLVGTNRVKIRNNELPAVVALTSETCLANVVGGPAFTMPCGDGDERFVGLQISSVFGKDAEVFAIGKRVVFALGRNKSKISLTSR